jgi:hypothetical protein
MVDYTSIQIARYEMPRWITIDMRMGTCYGMLEVHMYSSTLKFGRENCGRYCIGVIVKLRVYILLEIFHIVLVP